MFPCLLMYLLFCAFVLKVELPVSLTLTLVLSFSPSENIKTSF